MALLIFFFITNRNSYFHIYGQVEIKQEDKDTYMLEEDLDDMNNEMIEDDFIENEEIVETKTKKSSRNKVEKEDGKYLYDYLKYSL